MKVSKKIIDLETESAFAILTKATNLIKEGKDIINLGIGQPDFPTPKNIQEAGIKAIRDGHHGYTPSNGILPLREAVSEQIYKDHNVNVSPEQILITPGGKPTIFYSSLILGGEGNEIIYPDPGFPIYRSMINFSGAKGIPLELHEEDNFEINVNKLEQLITKNTSLIIINNPNNPTGSFMNKKKIDEIVKMLEKYPEIFIMSDEIYSKIIFNNQKMPSLVNYEALRERLIILDGWSKTFCMTGWRLGWSVWPNKLIKHVNKLCVNDHSCASSISQYAGIEAIRGPQNEVIKLVKEFQNRRNFIYEKLNQMQNINCIKPGGAFYAFPNISKTNKNCESFADEALMKYGVAVVPGSSFGNNANDFIRISYANSIENIKEGLDRLSNI